MSRLKVTCTTSAMFLALAALTLSSLAQQPAVRNGGGGRPGGGFGRGGFGVGFGGPGPGGGSVLILASNTAVQEDLKVSDKQKAQIKSLTDKYQEQSREIRTQLGQFFGGPRQGGGPRGKGQPSGGGQDGDPNAQGAQVGGGGFGGGQGQDPNAPGFGQIQGGGGNGGNGNGPPFQLDPERQQQFEMLRQGQEELRQTAEASLARMLEKGQISRLKQISLQLEGPSAVVCQNAAHPHGDMVDKLQIDEAQMEMVREVMGERRDAQRETRRARGEIMKTAFAALPRNAANNGQNGANNGQNGGSGENGGNGRNGGRGRGFDPEAMRKVMEDPKIQAQMEEIRGQEEKIDNQFSLAVNKVLTGRQRNIYKKMLGVPFDRTKMFGQGGPWGGRRGNGPGNQANSNNGSAAGNAGATAKANATNDDEGTTTAAKPSPSAPAKAKPAAAKRKSLRERRGIPDDNEN
jgi:Spy/CpxP family protein refolding chaperone